MQIKNIPFNMKTKLDVVLKEIPENENEMEQGVLWLDEKYKSCSTIQEQGVLLGHIGHYYCILGNYHKAEESLQQAMDIFSKENLVINIFVIKIKLAIVYQAMKKYSTCDTTFINAIKKIRSSKNKKIQKYLSLTLIQLGKSKFQQKFYKNATDLFIEALEENIAIGDLDSVKLIEGMIRSSRSKVKN